MKIRTGAAAVAVAIAAMTGGNVAAHPRGGDVDTVFGSGAARNSCGTDAAGRAYDPDTGRGAAALDAARQADGEIVLVGESGPADDTSNFCVIRIEADGRLDPGFGDGEPDTAWSGDGSTEIGFGGSEVATEVAIQPDGRAVVAGYHLVDGTETLAVTRLDTDGTLDTTFGDGGRRLVEGVGAATDLLVQPDGRIVLITGGDPVGGFDSATTETAVRLTADGSVDTSFGGGDGIASALPLSGSASSGALQPDGKILVAGATTSRDGIGSMFAARFNPDGSLDPGFDAFAFLGSFPATDAVLVGPDGSVTLVGSTLGLNPPIREARAVPMDVVLARFRPDGRPDRRFGGGGIVLHPLPGDNVSLDAAFADDGGVTVAGAARGGYFVAKTLPNGLLDRNFATRRVPLGDPAAAMAVVPTGAGRVVLAGPAPGGPFTAVQLLGPRTRALRCRG